MQGDIWSNLPLLYSSPSSCTGIITTPRCDLVHDKSPVINYLPLLSFDAFLERYGGFALLEHELHNNTESLRKLAEPLQLTTQVDLGLPLSELVQQMSSDADAGAEKCGMRTEHFKRQITSFQDCLARVERIKSLLKLECVTTSDIADLVPAKELRRYKLDIALNKVMDLHFLPPCGPLLPRSSIVTMRHIVTCGIGFLQTAQMCVSQQDWERVRRCKTTPDFMAAGLKPERLLRLKSPYIESLMFRLGTLFGRVGVRDIEPGQMESFLDN